MINKTRHAVTSVMHAANDMQVETASSTEVAEAVHEGLGHSTKGLADIPGGAQQLERDIAELTSRLASMVEQKDHMLNSMQTIASISEESAAATEEVTATITMQTEEVETITQNV